MESKIPFHYICNGRDESTTLRCKDVFIFEYLFYQKSNVSRNTMKIQLTIHDRRHFGLIVIIRISALMPTTDKSSIETWVELVSVIRYFFLPIFYQEAMSSTYCQREESSIHHRINIACLLCSGQAYLPICWSGKHDFNAFMVTWIEFAMQVQALVVVVLS